MYLAAGFVQYVLCVYVAVRILSSFTSEIIKDFATMTHKAPILRKSYTA